MINKDSPKNISIQDYHYDLPNDRIALHPLENRELSKLLIHQNNEITEDVFLNIAGGLKVEDPAIDLALVCAILSSNEDISIDATICFAGEVGLSGEIRPVNRVEQRIAEAERLGFAQIFISKYNKLSADHASAKIKVVQVAKIEDAFSLLFG